MTHSDHHPCGPRVFSDVRRQALNPRRGTVAAAKARGVKLGSARPGHWDGREHRRLAGSKLAAKAAGQAHIRNADEAYADLYPVLERLRGKGLSFQTIADHLNGKGYRTRRDKRWGPTQVARVLQRTGS
jgi:hypothetical protein